MVYRKSRRNLTRNRRNNRRNAPTRRNRRNAPTRRNRLNAPTRRNRRNRSRRAMMGGMAPLGDTSMNMPMKDSLAQGGQYLGIHKGQYGGGLGIYPNTVVQGSIINAAQAGGSLGPYPSSVVASTLPTAMIPASRTGPLDVAIAGIQGMQDGGRRNRNRRNRNRKTNRRKHRGGSHGGLHLSPAEVNANPMLLPSGLEKQAGLNYEWSMAKDPSAFLPKA